MWRRVWPSLAGLALGCLLAAGAAVLFTAPGRPPGPILSECDGRLRQVVIQYVAGADFTLGTYRDFLAALPDDVEVVLVCPDTDTRDELCRGTGQPPDRFRVVLTGGAMTAWSRDRWVALAGTDRTVLLAPAVENAADAWPARRGDEQIASHLAQTLQHTVTTRSRLQFDGGDFLADARRVFVAPAVLERNPALSEADITAELSRVFGKQIVHLRNAPSHHVGMYLAIAGEGVAIVGDPSLTTSTGSQPELLDPDSSPEIQRQFDDVAAQLKALGYRVERIPTAVQGRQYLTYVNGVIDVRDGSRTIYLPTYRHLGAVNHQATQVWQGLGYTVRPVDCTGVFRHFGTLHCLVNVLQRS
jgi:N-dimethylarginine dimethylaminohydrolase